MGPVQPPGTWEQHVCSLNNWVENFLDPTQGQDRSGLTLLDHFYLEGRG